MIAQPKPLAEITNEAIQVLFREIGVVNTIRFINQYTNGYGNYTEERREQLKDQSLEEIIEQIKSCRQ